MFTVKLAASDREMLVHHFLELPEDDRRLRFGVPVRGAVAAIPGIVAVQDT